MLRTLAFMVGYLAGTGTLCVIALAFSDTLEDIGAPRLGVGMIVVAIGLGGGFVAEWMFDRTQRVRPEDADYDDQRARGSPNKVESVCPEKLEASSKWSDS